VIGGTSLTGLTSRQTYASSHFEKHKRVVFGETWMKAFAQVSRFVFTVVFILLAERSMIRYRLFRERSIIRHRPFTERS
jgi:hypothetical protein